MQLVWGQCLRLSAGCGTKVHVILCDDGNHDNCQNLFFFLNKTRSSEFFRICACLMLYLCHKACDLHGGNKATVIGHFTLPISLTCYYYTVGYVT